MVAEEERRAVVAARDGGGLRRGGSASGSVGRLVRELETFLGRRVTLSGERGRCSDWEPDASHATAVRAVSVAEIPRGGRSRR